MSGLCKDHVRMQKDVPPVITSILRSLFYYHRASFAHDPTRLPKYLSKEDLEEIQSRIPIKNVWEWRQEREAKLFVLTG